MKIKVNRQRLATGISMVKGAMVSKGLEILKCIRLVAENGKAELAATDLNVEIIAEVECEVEESGSACLPGERMGAFVGALPEGSVEMCLPKEKTKMTIVGGHCRYGMDAADPKTYPKIDNLDDVNRWEMKVEELRQVFRRVRHCVSNDDIRATLKGVCMQAKGGTLVTVATDGKRLAMVENEIENKGEFEMILPTAAVVLLTGLLEKQKTGEVIISLGAKGVMFVGSGWTMKSRIIADKYPNWRQVVPKNEGTVVEFDRRQLLEELKRAALATVRGDANQSVKLTFEKSQLIIEGENGSGMQSKTMIPIKYSGEQTFIYLNPEYFEQILESLECESLRIAFDGPYVPIMMRCEEPFLAILMPLRFNK